jgi:hypothetical protein
LDDGQIRSEALNDRRSCNWCSGLRQGEVMTVALCMPIHVSCAGGDIRATALRSMPLCESSKPFRLHPCREVY